MTTTKPEAQARKLLTAGNSERVVARKTGMHISEVRAIARSLAAPSPTDVARAMLAHDASPADVADKTGLSQAAIDAIDASIAKARKSTARRRATDETAFVATTRDVAEPSAGVANGLNTRDVFYGDGKNFNLSWL